MIDYSIPTHLIRVIEDARPKIPLEAYTLATSIAKELTEILDKTGTVALSADYEYLLESMAKNDIPESLKNFITFPTDNPQSVQMVTDLLLDQLVTILDSVKKVKDEIEEQMIAGMKTQSRYIADKFSPITLEDEKTEDELFDVTNSGKRAMINSLEGEDIGEGRIKQPTVETKRKRFGLF
jgi:hypothetical protein